MKTRPRCFLLLASMCWFPTLCMGAATVAEPAEALSVNPKIIRTIDPSVLSRAIQRNPTQGKVTFNTRQLQVGAATQVVATDLAGKEITAQKVAGSQLSIASKPGQWVVLKPKTTRTANIAKGLRWLPGTCIVDERTYRSYVDFKIAPIGWNAGIGAYRVLASVGVALDGNPEATGPIGKTIPISFSVSGLDGVEINPGELVIEQLGIEGEQKFQIDFAKTTLAKPAIVLRSQIAANQEFFVDATPRLELIPESDPILGFGLEEVEVFARSVNALGAGLPESAGESLLVVTSNARRTPKGALSFSDDAHTTFSIRSLTLGTIGITASTSTDAGSIEGQVDIGTTMPVGQIIAALLGGMLGGFSRRFVKGAQKANATRHVIEGAAVSLIGFVAGVLGVGFLNIPSAIVATIAGAFLTGAVCGFLGVVVLEGLTRKVAPAAT